jgi:hypothetical protein
VRITAGAGAPFFDLTPLLAAERAFFYVRGSVIIGDGVNAVIDQPTALSDVTFLMGPGATIALDALSAEVTAVQTFVMDAGSGLVSDQPTAPAVVAIDSNLPLRWSRVLIVGPAITDVDMGDIALCDPSAAPAGVTLPEVTPYNSGQAICVKNASSSTNAITITPDGAQTIDGAATLALTTGRASVILVGFWTGAVGAWAVI